MWQTIGGIVALITAVVAYIAKKNEKAAKILEDVIDYAEAKSKTNESADDREDIENQEKRMTQEKVDELQKAEPQPAPIVTQSFASDAKVHVDQAVT